ncbi:MAG: hypothetical protein COT91_01850 [Candidatus Doudnabacteria bacterium CG10_big_fil_rev_8_21_14_0_10_41_10]|uniref:Uncharacterized protein n=1 Tax=Candidatus Doudnabacteria bacterium CG10_big_fil_rev_8_21_14_0_10_41_10 TaxID=1974551 RepID=A0A2H0VE57_9BACT|nr:MAG: hypothetical protein COT91_01850 [Candidatus Doudnabacteria bacterium CG10_big_fil_rev_8_21_14_0_10_41_10]
MALVACPECGYGKVASSAECCPECGNREWPSILVSRGVEQVCSQCGGSGKVGAYLPITGPFGKNNHMEWGMKPVTCSTCFGKKRVRYCLYRNTKTGAESYEYEPVT